MPSWKRFALLLAAATEVISTPPNFQQDPETYQDGGFHDEDPIKPGAHGAVACEAKECSQIGLDIMAAGGNAADAMVATTLCVGVVAPYHAGIGGGGFALVRSIPGFMEAVDFRETAPSIAYENMYEGNLLGSVYGGLAVGVPGELAGLDHIHGNYGSMKWKDVLTPVVKLAREGFKVNADTAKYMDLAMRKVGDNFLETRSEWAIDFAPNGTLLKTGDILTRKRYANTLEKIAEEGIITFYRGDIAKSTVKTIQDKNGTVRMYDMKNYKVELRVPLSTFFGEYRVWGIGAPAAGPVALNILKIIEQFDVHARKEDKYEEDLEKFRDDWKNGETDEDSLQNVTMHRFVEAMRFAYSARMVMGDPAFVEGMDDMTKDWLSERHAESVRMKIRDDRTLDPEKYHPSLRYTTDNHGTSHIVTTDKTGMAISLTSTINTLFGSLVMDNETGIIMNNEMNDFSIPGVTNEFGFPPSEANYIRANKRPLSSCTPLIVTVHDYGIDHVWAVLSAAGGSRIISATAYTLWRMLHGFGTEEAVKMHRMHDQLMPNNLLLEMDFDKGMAYALDMKGHNITYVYPGLSAVQAIKKVWNGTFEAIGEPRQ